MNNQINNKDIIEGSPTKTPKKKHVGFFKRSKSNKIEVNPEEIKK